MGVKSSLEGYEEDITDLSLHIECTHCESSYRIEWDPNNVTEDLPLLCCFCGEKLNLELKNEEDLYGEIFSDE